jgi:hypothetical protein
VADAAIAIRGRGEGFSKPLAVFESDAEAALLQSL